MTTLDSGVMSPGEAQSRRFADNSQVPAHARATAPKYNVIDAEAAALAGTKNPSSHRDEAPEQPQHTVGNTERRGEAQKPMQQGDRGPRGDPVKNGPISCGGGVRSGRTSSMSKTQPQISTALKHTWEEHEQEVGTHERAG